MLRRFNLNPLLSIVSALALALALSANWPAHGQSDKRDSAGTAERPRGERAEGTAAPESAARNDAGWIGVMLEQGENGRPQISEVFPGGPAAFAGLRAGDRVVKVGGRSVESVESFVSAIEQRQPGETMEITVDRGGADLTLKARVGSLRAFHRRYEQEMRRRDPDDPDYGLHPGVSPADMSLEMNRRLFEQNERIERTLREALAELSALRQDMEALKAQLKAQK